MNIGATSPEDAGLYFRYGDPVGYTVEQVGVDVVFDWDSYNNEVDEATGWESIKGGGKHPTGFKKYNANNFDILEPEDDAAVQNMGSNWRMPTSTEMQELIDYTTQTFIDLDGNEYSQEQAQNVVINENNLKGVKFTGSNGNSIFIPAAGYCNYNRHIAGIYVMNSTVCVGTYCLTLYFNSYDKKIKPFSSYRNYGHTIRGCTRITFI